ncbi:MAG TPA: deoxyguanosinetriphosphate triphosphohydrolase [Alteromonas australica]|uniref:Deoxyguanosinetriphosphate triphosphohydrolase n=1 Tax=Alteromonas australica TaxID=589873 RepID=A0A350P290_9ALTE|nr:deoxyguanosinetriphosphate triphosphohydrolase [Alteromonas australica]|tara:strand:+ start:280 stop:1677 length:1398 start_codon:yes stop_codon:yes gene_type:complete
MLDWEKLLNPIRRKDLYGESEVIGTGAGRTESERDYDRILFATPTRRLADKTQVFPMEQHDSIRTRLTHSHEVSNLARSIGVKIAFEHAEKVFGNRHEELQVKRVVPAILAAVGLAHDLGNPPFGHQGELAMQQWFRDGGAGNSKTIHPDFLEFDGNAQTLRLVTRLQVLNDHYGLNLTLGTLAALIKYPSIYGSGNKRGYKKYGVFKSEEKIIEEIWEHTGLGPGARHPFVYIMEACDDIAYSVIDAEDTVKKGYASFYDLMDHLRSVSNNDESIDDVVNKSLELNEKFKKDGLSSRELNDVSMQIFRAKAISIMIPAATDSFVENIQRIMHGNIESGFEIIENSRCGKLCEATKKFDRRHGFQHKDVLKLELEGSNHIKRMMSVLWSAVSHEDNTSRPFERYVFGDISENYRRVYKSSNKESEDNAEMLTYNRCQLICDAVSGMTESFLIKKNTEYKALKKDE